MRISDWSSDVCSSDLEFEAGLSYKPNKADWLEGKWSGIKVASGDARRGETAVDVDQLKRIGSRLCDVPDGFSLTSKLTRFIAGRRKAVETGEGGTWAFRDELAFGARVFEGDPLRRGGKGSERGTVSTRT